MGTTWLQERGTARTPWARVAVLALVLGALVVLVTSDALHRQLEWLVQKASPLIANHPVLGAGAFIVLSGLSAMLAFFSSALLVPVAIQTWGELGTLGLLWVGWIAGGVCAFGIARRWGRTVIRRLTSERALAKYDQRLSPDTPFGLVLLFQLAVPSEIPGYVLGLARYPFRRYLAVVALGELPYAIGTVYLGVTVVERNVLPLVVIGALAIALTVVAIRALRKRL